ncbi:MAG TPA: DUF2157 domain-containing protein [Solimonas sp.]|nr:DUF2157 domain-containing protein [Solimonas sp.]
MNGPEWLLQQLPALQQAGVIDSATGERLRTHYASLLEARPGLARILFTVLGALLIGLGVILLVAHNWDNWPRGLRLAAAFAPLLLGQLACAAVLWRARDSVAWSESAAVFTAAAFAAALALVGQIFHFPGDLDRYLLTCSLAALPLVYLLRASLTAVICALGFAGWAGSVPWGGDQPLLALLLFALLLPHVWRSWRVDSESFRTTFLLYWLVPALFVAVLLSLPQSLRLGWLWFAECGALLWLLPGAAPGLQLRRPLQGYGSLAVAAVALAGSYTDFWQHEWYGRAGEAAMQQAWILLGLVLAAVLFLGLRALRERAWLRAMGAFPALLLWLGLALDFRDHALWPALLCNLYVAGLGLAILRAGIAQRRMRIANGGLALIAALVLARFFDGDWSFTVRGLAFIGVGVGFFIANFWLRRRVQA